MIRPAVALRSPASVSPSAVLPLAVAPHESDHLAGPHLQVERVELAVQREALGAQDGFGVLSDLARGGMPGGGAAGGLSGHRRDQVVLGERGDGGAEHMAGVTVDGDGGAQFVHLLQMVGDEEERHSLALQFPQLPEQPLDASGVELGGRLVEDDQPGTEGQGLRDLDELPLLDGEILGPCGGVDAHPVLGEQFRGPPPEPGPADEAAAGAAGLEAVEEEVLGDGQIGHDHRLLVDAGDLGLPGRRGAEGGCGLASEGDRARVGPVQSGEHADEGGLACSVAPDECVGLAGCDGEPYSVECEGRAEALDDAFRLDGGRCLVGHG